MRARVSRMVMAILLLAAGPGALRGGAAAPPTRDALETARRRVAALETELALASTRKPYIVLDLDSETVRYRLLGMTLREVPLPGVHAQGLVRGVAAQTDAPALAGIFTVREKDGDPRLDPLTPEQVEAGADDENVANVLPPEPPKAYRVRFKQPVVVHVARQDSGVGVRHGWSVLRSLWHRVRGAGGEEPARLELSVRLDAKTGDEVYRSLIPDLKWLVLPPRGYSLPQVGQEAPPKPKPPRAVPKPPPKPLEPPGVPFQIPSPVTEGDAPAEALEPVPEQGPAPEEPPPVDEEPEPPDDGREPS